MEPGTEAIRPLDPTKLISLLRRRVWVVFLLLGAGLAAAFIYTRYADYHYRASGTLKVSLLNSERIVGNGITPSAAASYQEAEIEILQSRDLLSQVVDSLELGISYYREGQVRNSLLWQTMPFKVVLADDFNAFNQTFYVRKTATGFDLWRANDDANVVQGKFGEQLALGQARFTLVTAGERPFDTGDLLSFTVHEQEVAISRLNRSISINNPRSGLFRIQCEDLHPDRAAAIVNAIQDFYLQQELKLSRRSTEQTLEFIDNYIAEFSKVLEQSEDSLTRTESQQRVPVVSAEKDIRLQQYADFQAELSTLQLKEISLRRLRQYIQANYIDLTQEDIPALPILGELEDATILSLLNSLNEAIAERLKLLRFNAPTNPIVVEKNTEIRRMLTQLSQSLAQMEAALQDRQAFLRGEIGKISGQVRSYPSLERDLARVGRSYELAQKTYSTLMERKIELLIENAAIISNSRIVDRALSQRTPVSPRKGLIYAVCTIAGLFLALLVIVGREQLRTTFHNSEELEQHTMVPIIGQIVKAKAVKTDEDFGLRVFSEPNSAMAESFRALRSNLEFIASKLPQRRIAVTSTVSGEGKSFISLNLAASYALLKRKVLLIDLDLRKPRLHTALGLSNENGITNAIMGISKPEEVVIKTGFEYLDFIPSGSLPPNPAELITNSAFSELMDLLSKQYPVIIMDTSPIGLVVDSIPVIAKADVGLYIMRANYSRRSYLNNLEKLVADKQFKHLFVALNCSEMNERGYGYGYEADHGYYSNGHAKGLKAVVEKVQFWKQT